MAFTQHVAIDHPGLDGASRALGGGAAEEGRVKPSDPTSLRAVLMQVMLCTGGKEPHAVSIEDLAAANIPHFRHFRIRSVVACEPETIERHLACPAEPQVTSALRGWLGALDRVNEPARVVYWTFDYSSFEPS